MDNGRHTSQALTTFSMEEILKIPHGVVQEYATPLRDRKGSLKMVITGEMGIIDGTMITTKPVKPLEHFNDKPFVEMNFILEGNFRQTHGGLLNRYLLEKGYNNILYNPYSLEKNELPGIGSHRIFTAHILPEKMSGLFTGYIPEFASLAENIGKNKPFVLHAPVKPFNNQLKYFFDTFWDCPAPLALRKLYFEGKILDLLCRQCEMLIETDIKEIAVPKAEIDKVYYAREILLSNIINPPSFTELARQCCLNEFKLKKYFKALFQTSVFGFVYEERLKMARQLIYQGEKNISAIAYELGYAHPQHFQRAFKKRYGVTPKSLLK